MHVVMSGRGDIHQLSVSEVDAVRTVSTGSVVKARPRRIHVVHFICCRENLDVLRC